TALVVGIVGGGAVSFSPPFGANCMSRANSDASAVAPNNPASSRVPFGGSDPVPLPTPGRRRWLVLPTISSSSASRLLRAPPALGRGESLSPTFRTAAADGTRRGVAFSVVGGGGVVGFAAACRARASSLSRTGCEELLGGAS